MSKATKPFDDITLLVIVNEFSVKFGHFMYHKTNKNL